MVQIEPGLGLLMYRDGAGEDARALVGADVLGVQGVAEEHLPGGHPGRPFGDDHLGAVGLLRPPGADGEDALLDSQADGLGGDAAGELGEHPSVFPGPAMTSTPGRQAVSQPGCRH